MGLSGSSACVKYLLFIFNLIFLITGITILSIGGVVQGAYNKYEPILNDGFFSVPALLIATGVIILIVSFFGCCGAVKENHCMIMTFSALLILIFILELAAGIAGYMLEDSAHKVLEDKMFDSMKRFRSDNSTALLWNGIQDEFTCCGTQNYTDWSAVFNSTSLPLSCCKNPQAIGANNCSESTIRPDTPGCLEALGTFVIHHAVALGGAGIGIAIVQFLGIILSCCLARAVRNHYESV